MNVLFYFLHAILCHEHTNPLRTIIERSFRHCCQGRPFLTEHRDVTTIDLWRHANAKYWYCAVIFVYCHCTRKLVQRRSSLVNNSREYRYLTTRYSRRVRRSYSSIPKLQCLHRWSLGMDKLFHPIHYWPCDYLSMLGSKLIYASKMGPRPQCVKGNSSNMLVTVSQPVYRNLCLYRNVQVAVLVPVNNSLMTVWVHLEGDLW